MSDIEVDNEEFLDVDSGGIDEDDDEEQDEDINAFLGDAGGNAGGDAGGDLIANNFEELSDNMADVDNGIINEYDVFNIRERGDGLNGEMKEEKEFQDIMNNIIGDAPEVSELSDAVAAFNALNNLTANEVKELFFDNVSNTSSM